MQPPVHDPPPSYTEPSTDPATDPSLGAPNYHTLQHAYDYGTFFQQSDSHSRRGISGSDVVFGIIWVSAAITMVVVAVKHW
jgi:hypothetical protein